MKSPIYFPGHCIFYHDSIFVIATVHTGRCYSLLPLNRFRRVTQALQKHVCALSGSLLCCRTTHRPMSRSNGHIKQLSGVSCMCVLRKWSRRTRGVEHQCTCSKLDPLQNNKTRFIILKGHNILLNTLRLYFRSGYCSQHVCIRMYMNLPNRPCFCVNCAQTLV